MAHVSCELTTTKIIHHKRETFTKKKKKTTQREWNGHHHDFHSAMPARFNGYDSFFENELL